MDEIPVFDADIFREEETRKIKEAKRKKSEFQVVNVDDLKKPPKKPGDELWQNQLIYWFAISLAFSGIFVLLSFFLKGLLILALLPPPLAISVFYIRRLLKDKNSTTDQMLG